MEKLKLYKKQIIIGLSLLIGAILGVKMMFNDVEVVEEVPVVCKVVDTTEVVEVDICNQWMNERDSIDNAMRYWYAVLDTNSDGDIDH